MGDLTIKKNYIQHTSLSTCIYKPVGRFVEIYDHYVVAYTSPLLARQLLDMHIDLVLRSRGLTTVVWFGLNPKAFNRKIFSRRSYEYSKRWFVRDSVDETSSRSRKIVKIFPTEFKLQQRNDNFSMLPHSAGVDENSIDRLPKRVPDEFVFRGLRTKVVINGGFFFFFPKTEIQLL